MAANKKLMTVDEVQGAWAIMPTPATDNASDWHATDTVDADEVTRAVEGMVDAGIDGILSLGTLGECATLTRDEKRKFIGTAVEAAAGRIPFFAGTTALGTRETIEQTREAQDLGAAGTMLGLPMWCAADMTTAVKFYKDVAEACPDMAICVYANHAAFRFAFATEFWEKVADIPQVIMAKYGAIPTLAADLEATKGKVKFLPIEAMYLEAVKVDPKFCNAFWSSGAACDPSLASHIRDVVAQAVSSNDFAAAEELIGEVGKTLWPLIPGGNNFEEFNKYNIGLEKERINAGGWMKAGPCRPPYTYVPEEYLDGARASGRGWAELAKKVKA
ncbi:dihydrodipicolinate synthase family protein [Emcibacter sp.]|uniref:dihydrodipicolinate synthase family protein n=1 Tax=Emcibacter sp. TaxID=1979954 RepID=UPI002AA943EA|nr:dihydrodipicolinate synthase family protein [Emcibacter sp.]